MNKTLIVALLTTVSASAMAAAPAPSANLDVYYVDSSIDDGSSDEDGNGFGARIAGKVADNIKLYGEYQTVNYDDSDVDLDQIRAGASIGFSQSDALNLFGKLEFINLKADGGGADESESGFGVHGGLAFNVTPEFQLLGSLGYLDVGDFGDGLEYNLGASFDVTPAISLVANYRVTDLEDGDFGGGSFDTKVDDIQLGVRFRF
ncbi:outer membrane protein [Solimonas fluminis]|nr:outer membrane beta-barrel protein [Solimonas fluminis]